MGADLYIKDMPREPQYRGFEVRREAVEVGYFRDCYNASGLFAFLCEQTGEAWSWWRLAGERELFDDEGDMTPAGAAVFLGRVRAARDAVAWDRLPGEQAREYRDWLDLLIRFLELAVERQSPIIFSV